MKAGPQGRGALSRGRVFSDSGTKAAAEQPTAPEESGQSAHLLLCLPGQKGGRNTQKHSFGGL